MTADPEKPDLFDRMVGEGHALLTLALVGTPGGATLTERERGLVKAAVEAGVLGAWGVLREEPPPLPGH